MGDDTHGLWTVEDCAVCTFFLLRYMTFSIPLLTLCSSFEIDLSDLCDLFCRKNIIQLQVAASGGFAGRHNGTLLGQVTCLGASAVRPPPYDANRTLRDYVCPGAAHDVLLSERPEFAFCTCHVYWPVCHVLCESHWALSVRHMPTTPAHATLNTPFT